MERLKEVFREHAEAHANEMMQDMFVCLGQEGEKVARLRGALESRGVDTRALLADLDEEEDSAFGERKSIVCDINYRVVGGDGAELKNRGGLPALEPATRTAAPAEGPRGGLRHRRYGRRPQPRRGADAVPDEAQRPGGRSIAQLQQPARGGAGRGWRRG